MPELRLKKAPGFDRPLLVENLGGVRTRQIPELNIPDLPGAACKDHPDPDLFFPGPGQGGRQKRDKAIAICEGCPVREACLEVALEWDRNHEPIDWTYGVWGGTTRDDRKKMLKEKNRVA